MEGENSDLRQVGNRKRNLVLPVRRAALRVLGVNAAVCESWLSETLPFLHERLVSENLFGKAPENFLELCMR